MKEKSDVDVRVNGASRSSLALLNVLLVSYVFTLPLMNPPVAGALILADSVFVLLMVTWIIALARGKLRLEWSVGHWVLLGYFLSLSASLLTTQSLGVSAAKLATQAYLVTIPIVISSFARTEADLRRLVQAWVAAATVLALLALISIPLFFWAPDNPLLQYTRSRLGSLPAGAYLRLDLTFSNMNLACNYLTASIGLTLIAWQQKWLLPRTAILMCVAYAIAAAATISPGLGGVVLVLTGYSWLLNRHKRLRAGRFALVLGIFAAGAFVLAAAVTPVPAPGAPFVINVPGTEILIGGSPRTMTWIAALQSFFEAPLLGRGIGIDAVGVHFITPSGVRQNLTDAHNMYLNIAAQTGLVGLTGLLALLAYVWRVAAFSRADTGGAYLLRSGLGLIFLNIIAYQGLTGSFEDTRHAWVVLGMFLAVANLPFSESPRAINPVR